jgi:hypothetical protein
MIAAPEPPDTSPVLVVEHWRGRTMRTTLLGLALATSLIAAPAFASQCPALMGQIDEALATADISEEERAQVLELRQRGEEEHEAGNHEASEQTLEEAKAILGI